MRGHTYTEENDMWKCNDCDFKGKNVWTLQIHNGMHHSKPVECGLCDFQAKDFDNLNLHIKTCEIYECNECEHVSNNISSIKKHMKSNNDCSIGTIHHVKISRYSDNEADQKEYEQHEL